ncbi:MAG: amidohydrolase [bacterium]
MANLLIKNALVRTMNLAQPSAREIIVSNGKIDRVGENVGCPQIGCVLDLAGKTVVPAFWDAHVHFFQTGIRKIEFDGEDAKSESELLDMLSDWVREHGEVNGYGYDPADSGDLPTKAQLNSISEDFPILLRRIDGHSSCVNSSMLKLLGDEVAELKSAYTHRGWLFGEAHICADRFAASRIVEEKLVEAAYVVAREALAVGCGTIVALVPRVDWMVLLLGLDLPINIIPRLETLRPTEAAELGLKRVGGCMPMADGAFGSHSALLTEEYCDRPGCFGTREIEQGALNKWMAESTRLNLSPAVHAIGDGAVDMVLDAIDALPKDLRPIRPRIEHAELLRDEQIERIAELGVSLAMQPVFDALWGGNSGLYFTRMGERWRKMNRFRDILDAGIVIAGSSDSYITPIDPLAGIRAAMLHRNHAQRVSVDEAIGMFTFGAAKSEGMEEIAGRIEPGKKADFTVLSGDIEKNPESVNIEMTIIGGEILYNRNKNGEA